MRRKGLGKNRANLASPNTYFNKSGGNRQLTKAKSGTKKPKRRKV
jgi:hypothetical protein